MRNSGNRQSAIGNRQSAIGFLGLALALTWTAAWAQGTSPVEVVIGGRQDDANALLKEYVSDLAGGGFSQQSLMGNLKGGKMATRRPDPAAPELNVWLDYEAWDGEGRRGVDGHRFTVLANYTWGLDEDSEISVTLPYQRLSLTTFDTKSGLNDTEVAYRRYVADQEDPQAPTYVVSGRVLLPTGDADKGIGLGEFSAGVSAMVTKPLGRSLGYCGVGYTFFGELEDADTENAFNAFLGGMTPVGKQMWTQYDLSHFASPFGEAYTRLLLGLRRMLTPTAGIQLNLRQEFQADGDSRSVSLGYVIRY
jgi:hypothetical protein